MREKPMFIINRGINKKEREYRKMLEKDYENRIQDIVCDVRGNCTTGSKVEISKRIFDWFCDNIKFDEKILDGKKENGSYSNKIYQYKDGEFFSSEKYSILCGQGICIGVSTAIKDVFEKFGIECRCVSGTDNNVVKQDFKGRHHAWNEIDLEGKTYTIDWTPHLRTFMTEPRTAQKQEVEKSR
jgi:transglutaminase/protease-like cytokinesis protein 3